MATFEDFKELVQLRSSLSDKVAKLAKLFPGGTPATAEAEFTPEQKRAIRDADEAWEKFRQKAKELGGYVD
ncbi:MAG: hypothetical protein IMY77_02680 [Chloroflexi bacterium]|nr:hypothetical protein [Chloroflexota bacterium]